MHDVVSWQQLKARGGMAWRQQQATHTLCVSQETRDVNGGLEVLSNMKAAGIQPDQVHAWAIRVGFINFM